MLPFPNEHGGAHKHCSNMLQNPMERAARWRCPVLFPTEDACWRAGSGAKLSIFSNAMQLTVAWYAMHSGEGRKCALEKIKTLSRNLFKYPTPVSIKHKHQYTYMQISRAQSASHPEGSWSGTGAGTTPGGVNVHVWSATVANRPPEHIHPTGLIQCSFCFFFSLSLSTVINRMSKCGRRNGVLFCGSINVAKGCSCVECGRE